MARGDIEIEGFAELERRLESLTPLMRKRVMRTAMRKGATIYADEARRRVPVRSGVLKESIRVGASLNRRTGDPQASVRAGGKFKRKKIARDAWYATLVEYGTEPHKISAPRGKALRLYGGRLVQSVDHPGSRPQPFMRPAFDGQTRAAIDAIADAVRTGLAKALKK